MYSVLALVLLGATPILAQADIPLAQKKIPFDQIPEQVDTTNGPRGIQTGINRCNSTTENQDSLCQTAIVNSLEDFCIWGPQKPNQSIADTEGELVAWCTKPGHGTRIIPPNALIGVQFMKTPDYLQVTGKINQTLINIIAGDSGGEEDPHGADGRGNPLGSLVYSTGFPGSAGSPGGYLQVSEWHNFLGGDQFCFKVCDPAGPNAANFCQHIYDRIGCLYNAPAAYQEGVFESCLGDNQDFPGVFTGSDGVVSTYSQPPESLGVISSMPYQPKVPASSSCTPVPSAQLYAAAASLFPSASASASTTAATSGASKAPVASGNGGAAPTSGSGSSSAAGAKQTGSNGAAGVKMSGLLAVLAAVGIGAAL